VEAGERLGLLPGDMKDNGPLIFQPLYDALHDMIPSRKAGAMGIEDGTVQIAPLPSCAGETLENSFVILDEAHRMPLSAS